jgi:hypothetical protein
MRLHGGRHIKFGSNMPDGSGEGKAGWQGLEATPGQVHELAAPIILEPLFEGR